MYVLEQVAEFMKTYRLVSNLLCVLLLNALCRTTCSTLFISFQGIALLDLASSNKQGRFSCSAIADCVREVWTFRPLGTCC